MGLEKATLRKYLLGGLPNRDAEELDLRIIEDQSLEDQLIQIEDELLEEYLDGTLTSEETQLFQNNFLVLDERRVHLKHIQLLRRHAGEIRSKTDLEDEKGAHKESLVEKLNRFLRVNLRPTAAGFAIVLLVLASLLGWRLFFYQNPAAERARVKREFTELNKSDLSDLSRFQGLSIESLHRGLYRDSSDVKSLVVKELTDQVVFQLPLPSEIDPESSFTADLVREETVIFSLSQLRSYDISGGKELRVILPSELLNKGDYEIRVKPENFPGLTINYPFTAR